MNQDSIQHVGNSMQVENLRTYYGTESGEVQAVEDVSFEVGPKETVGIVGESGCGKTTVGLSLIGALPPQGEIVQGSIKFSGQDITTLEKKEKQALKWKEISMIYQGAMNAFNPVFTIGQQIRETLDRHNIGEKSERKDRVARLLEKVDLEAGVASKYPHQLSGGMKQRAAIALAISCKPSILIADEPTTGIDVVLQAKVLQTLNDLQEEIGFGMVFISHDIATVMNICDKIGVMYAGNLVEWGSSIEIYDSPSHPYTRMLFRSIINPKAPPERIISIPGTPPNLSNPPKGCRFAPRCPLATPECEEQAPPLESLTENSSQKVACYHTDRIEEI